MQQLFPNLERSHFLLRGSKINLLEVNYSRHFNDMLVLLWLGLSLDNSESIIHSIVGGEFPEHTMTSYQTIELSFLENYCKFKAHIINAFIKQTISEHIIT